MKERKDVTERIEAQKAAQSAIPAMTIEVPMPPVEAPAKLHAILSRDNTGGLHMSFFAGEKFLGLVQPAEHGSIWAGEEEGGWRTADVIGNMLGGNVQERQRLENEMRELVRIGREIPTLAPALIMLAGEEPDSSKKPQTFGEWWDEYLASLERAGAGRTITEPWKLRAAARLAWDAALQVRR